MGEATRSLLKACVMIDADERGDPVKRRSYHRDRLRARRRCLNLPGYCAGFC